MTAMPSFRPFSIATTITGRPARSSCAVPEPRRNMDLGDSCERAGNTLYPKKFSALGSWIGANFVIYSMTH